MSAICMALLREGEPGWLPSGVACTKLTNDYFESNLAIISTSRNWKTRLKLREIMRQ